LPKLRLGWRIGGMKSRRFWVLLFAVVLVVAACGGDDSADPPAPDPDLSSEDSSTDRDTDDGADNDDGDGAPGTPPASGDLPDSVPDDFPIAIPSGWEVDFNSEIGLTVSSPRLLYPADAYNDIVAFYEEWTDAQPEEYARAEGPQGVIFTRMESPPYIITITPDHEERDATWTLLVASGSADDS
jgi:hypothetical protein